MERETGIEPVTSSLGSWRSTAELLPLADGLSYLRLAGGCYWCLERRASPFRARSVPARAGTPAPPSRHLGHRTDGLEAPVVTWFTSSGTSGRLVRTKYLPIRTGSAG